MLFLVDVGHYWSIENWIGYRRQHVLDCIILCNKLMSHCIAVTCSHCGKVFLTLYHFMWYKLIECLMECTFFFCSFLYLKIGFSNFEWCYVRESKNVLLAFLFVLGFFGGVLLVCWFWVVFGGRVGFGWVLFWGFLSKLRQVACIFMNISILKCNLWLMLCLYFFP